MNLSDVSTLLLDLDGTLTDSMPGITKSVRYALNYFHIPVNDLSELRPFVGPPLKDSFIEYYGFTEEQASTAVHKYGEYFNKDGIFDNELYKGTEDFLKSCCQKGMTVLLATSKPTHLAEKILEYFQIRPYFTGVYGSNPDGTRLYKDEVIGYTMQKHAVSPRKAVMIGDRKHDITGAKKNNLRSIGVLYGYGSREELEKAGADFLVNNYAELEKLLEL